ncbi:hypothetical protein NQ317_015807 [Molorchus minor]|uniref:Uncharacterized protein n=1 Tax=Molorchus minor TaxID=1323400 RepID=A0ABQ9IVB7_9CUCU|nr:hypothetical protein NQ317_015807 [Molorchus minor]
MHEIFGNDPENEPLSIASNGLGLIVLSNTAKQYSTDTIRKLSKSFYVDNRVTSVPDEEAVNTFISDSVAAMAEGQFELRGVGSFLEILMMKIVISLFLDLHVDTENLIVTKRQILSLAQKVFDPIGFTVPTTLVPKLLLQSLWEKQISWDTPVDDEIKTAFKRWASDLQQHFFGATPQQLSPGFKETRNGVHLCGIG